MIETISPAVWMCSNSEYHSDFSRDSHSSLELFRESVIEYAALRIHRTIEPSDPTPEMLLGSAFHCLILEPAEFGRRYVLAPKFDRRTKAGKEDFAAWQSDNGDKQPLDLDDMKQLHAMRDGLMANQRAKRCLELSGHLEHTLVWDDPLTGCPLKMRTDKLLDNGLIVDLKTTNDVRPDSWAKSVAQWHYHCQEALYRDGAREAIGLECQQLFVAVCKRPPHETVCFVLDEEAIEHGREQNRATIRELVDRRDRNDWSGKWANETVTINLPRWAYRS